MNIFINFLFFISIFYNNYFTNFYISNHDFTSSQSTHFNNPILNSVIVKNYLYYHFLAHKVLKTHYAHLILNCASFKYCFEYYKRAYISIEIKIVIIVNYAFTATIKKATNNAFDD